MLQCIMLVVNVFLQVNGIKMPVCLRQCGNKKDSFLRDTITPLITEDTQVYRELESEIFI